MTYWRTARPMSGDEPSAGPHFGAGGTRADQNLLAGDPPRRFDLAVVRDSPFIHQRELNPVEPLDPRLDHRELAAYVMLGLFITLFFGIPLAVAAAMLEY